MSFLFVAIAVFGSNIFGMGFASYFVNVFYMPVIGLLVIVSFMILYRFKGKGSIGKSWIFFAIASGSWFIAELIWVIYENILHLDPWPSEADIFWVIGHVTYFVFVFFYLKPFTKNISKQMIIGCSFVAVILLVPSIVISYDYELELNSTENILGITYPIINSINLIPALLGVILFFKGKVSIFWSLMSFGIICDIIGDAGWLFTTLEDVYYSGHPVEIVYLWAYVFFIFGIISQLTLFKKKSASSVKTLQ